MEHPRPALVATSTAKCWDHNTQFNSKTIFPSSTATYQLAPCWAVPNTLPAGLKSDEHFSCQQHCLKSLSGPAPSLPAAHPPSCTALPAGGKQWVNHCHSMDRRICKICLKSEPVRGWFYYHHWHYLCQAYICLVSFPCIFLSSSASLVF